MWKPAKIQDPHAFSIAGFSKETKLLSNSADAGIPSVGPMCFTYFWFFTGSRTQAQRWAYNFSLNIMLGDSWLDFSTSGEFVCPREGIFQVTWCGQWVPTITWTDAAPAYALRFYC